MIVLSFSRKQAETSIISHSVMLISVRGQLRSKMDPL